MPVDDPDLVTVFETDDSFALKLAVSSLEDAGIEFFVIGPASWYLGGVPGLYPTGEVPLGTGCAGGIQVARESERQARELLEPLVNPVELADPDAPAGKP